jgi:hypothetical protein
LQIDNTRTISVDWWVNVHVPQVTHRDASPILLLRQPITRIL